MPKVIHCPICQKPEQKPHSPFCSQRCADVDLGRWFRGDYAIPVVETDDDELDDDSPEGSDVPQ